MMNNNLTDMMNQFSSFMSNPTGYLIQSKLGIPSNIASDPNQVMQYLLSNGKINQSQVNQANAMAQQLRGMIK